LGTAILWTALITWPLIAAIQMACARIGIVTGHGLARALGEKFPRPLVATISLALLVANTITVGADLSAMADAAEMLSGLNSHYYVIFFGLIIGIGTVVFRYRQMANLLKWFSLSLFTYALTAFVLHPDWSASCETFQPRWPTAGGLGRSGGRPGSDDQSFRFFGRPHWSRKCIRRALARTRKRLATINYAPVGCHFWDSGL
jgi:Mn2+/Fe2+ NRAMP family transporter